MLLVLGIVSPFRRTIPGPLLQASVSDAQRSLVEVGHGPRLRIVEVDIQGLAGTGLAFRRQSQLASRRNRSLADRDALAVYHVEEHLHAVPVADPDPSDVDAFQLGFSLVSSHRHKDRHPCRVPLHFVDDRDRDSFPPELSSPQIEGMMPFLCRTEATENPETRDNEPAWFHWSPPSLRFPSIIGTLSPPVKPVPFNNPIRVRIR